MAARTASRPRTRRALEQPAWQPSLLTEFLIETYGGVSKIASVLDVSKSQPSRWRTSEEVPGPVAIKKLLALDAVLRRALTLWGQEAAVVWLESPNAYLDHARPVDVAMTRGASEVLEALEAEAEGAFA